MVFETLVSACTITHFAYCYFVKLHLILALISYRFPIKRITIYQLYTLTCPLRYRFSRLSYTCSHTGSKWYLLTATYSRLRGVYIISFVNKSLSCIVYLYFIIRIYVLLETLDELSHAVVWTPLPMDIQKYSPVSSGH